MATSSTGLFSRVGGLVSWKRRQKLKEKNVNKRSSVVKKLRECSFEDYAKIGQANRLLLKSYLAQGGTGLGTYHAVQTHRPGTGGPRTGQ